MVLKMRNLTARTNTFLSALKRNFGDTISLTDSNYQNQRSKVKVRCNIHRVEYFAWPGHLVRGDRVCKCCSTRLTLQDFINKSRQKHGAKYSYDKVIFVNSTTKVIITCPEHGDWTTKPITHYHNGSGCPTCAINNSRLSVEKFITNATKVHGRRYNYDRVTIMSNRDDVTIGCPEHGYYQQPARSHLAGHGCPKCALVRTRNSLETFIKQAKSVHGNVYKYDKSVYVNSKTKLIVTCKRHGDFSVTPNSHISNNTGCGRCRESYGEKMVAKYLNENSIQFKKEYSIPGSRYRYDFYLIKHNVLIEFNGIQHYEPVDRFGGAEAYFKTICNDLAKVLLAEKNKIPLITLTHTDLSDGALFDRLKEAFVRFNVVS